MKVIIDRIEGEYAVCEVKNGVFSNIPLVLLEGAKEGDIVNIEILKEETAIRKENLQKRLNNLFK